MGVSVAYYHGEKGGNNGSATTLNNQAERDVTHLSAKYAMGPVSYTHLTLPTSDLV